MPPPASSPSPSPPSPSSNAAGFRWKPTLAGALVIALVASTIGVADVFFVRKKTLEIAKPVAANQTPPKAPTDTPPAQPVGSDPVKPGVAVPDKPAPGPPSPPSPPPAPILDPNMITLERCIELFARMISAGDVRFVDARNEEDYVKGRIPTAVNLPPTKFGGVIPPEVDQLQRDASIVIYCGGGECDASKLTALRLNELGFNTTLIFHDGFPAWVKAGQPVEK